jgi:CheY-like chemotaxis protein/anti-sigma regulatory factor (Ser/Thr protein kinase)
VAQIAQLALETVRPAADAKGVGLEVAIDGNAGTVSGDPERLQQVIWNLLSNAMKFTDSGGRVRLDVRRDGRHVQIVVSDGGAGISRDFLPHVFERFRQEDASTTRKHGGLGLGLAIVRSLVEMHGGVVSAASRGRGCGATFTIRIPLAGYSELDTSTIDEALPDKMRALRVLVVDDNVDAAQTLGELLAVMGHLPLVVHDGPAALKAVQTFAPEVAFLDIGLPVVNGYELAKQLRAIAALAHAPLVAITGYGQPADVDRANAAGFVEHLVKPLSPETLRVVLARLTA